MVIVNDLRSGMAIEQDNNLLLVLDVSHNKTAMRQMIVKVKVRNMRTNSITELTYTGGDKVETAHIEKVEMQYLYDSGDALVFMDTSTYEQIEIQKDRLEWEINFLVPNLNITVTMYEGEVLGLSLPDKVAMEIVEAEPAVKGDTATGAMKNATVETGLLVKVPLFIDSGERILVTTADGKYSSREK